MFDVVFTFNLQHSTFNHNRYQQEGCTWCEAVREIRYSTAHKKALAIVTSTSALLVTRYLHLAYYFNDAVSITNL